MIEAPPPETAELIEQLRATECYSSIRAADDGSQLVAMRQMVFTWAIFAGLDEAGYEDQWCFESATAAAMAFVAWSGNMGTEPDGWIRHPKSGRRRPGGDATREYVAR